MAAAAFVALWANPIERTLGLSGSLDPRWGMHSLRTAWMLDWLPMLAGTDPEPSGGHRPIGRSLIAD